MTRATWLGLVAVCAACALFRADPDVITGSGRVTQEARAVDGFDSVALRGSGELSITQGASEALVVEAEDNLLPHIVTEVDGSTLEIGFDRATWQSSLRPTKPIRYQLTVRQLEAVELGGAGNVLASSLRVGDLRLDLAGSGSVTIEHLEAGRLDVILSGTGSIAVAGEVADQAITLSGAGEYVAGDLESRSAEVDLPGSGDVTVWATESLDIDLSGTGTVSYWGDPDVQRRLSGSGDINPMGDK
jgi:hypothetical protein